MAKTKFDPEAFKKRHQQMRVNAGDWLLKNSNAFKLCQVVLLEKYYEAVEKEDASSDLNCFLCEIEEAVDLFGQLVADLRNAEFWPKEEA